LPKVTDVKLEQDWNAELPILVTELPKVTDVIWLFDWNAFGPMLEYPVIITIVADPSSVVTMV
jgi:hypothetical protein